MNSTQQQCFLMAVEQGNFTRAAEQLFITQPALSRNISNLEEELGLILFTRSNNVLELTPGGRLLYGWMRQVKKDFAHVLVAARRANAEPEQPLRIGFVKSEIPTPETAAALQKLRRMETELEVIISHHQAMRIVEDVEHHSMDVAVMISSATLGHPRLVSRRLDTLQRCMAVSILHPLAERERASVSDFKGDIFASIKPEVSPTMSVVAREVCSMAGFVPMLIEADSVDEQIDWIESGRGVGLVVSNHMGLHNPLIKLIPLEENLPVELVCVWDRLNVNPHIQKFVDAFSDQ